MTKNMHIAVLSQGLLSRIVPNRVTGITDSRLTAGTAPLYSL